MYFIIMHGINNPKYFEDPDVSECTGNIESMSGSICSSWYVTWNGMKH
jgi:hypothetical protein